MMVHKKFELFCGEAQFYALWWYVVTFYILIAFFVDLFLGINMGFDFYNRSVLR